MTINASDIEEYLQTRSDFDLELFVYRTLRERGFSVAHGGTYIDPATTKPRQYDLRAYGLLSRTFGFGVHLSIECKSLSTDAPLVISRVPRPTSDSYHELIHVHKDPQASPPEVRIAREQKERGIYRPFNQVGKRTAQVRRDQGGRGFKDDDRESYEKWSQALSSAADLVRESAEAQPSADLYVSILPILVVSDDTLWVVDYSEEGKRLGPPKPTDEAELFVDRDYPIRSLNNWQAGPLVYHISHLHIFTRTGLVSFLSQLTDRTGSRLEALIFDFVLREFDRP